MSEVCLVTKRMPHHGGYSGYHQLARYLPPTRQITPSRLARSTAGRWWKWRGQHLPHPTFYGYADCVQEFELLATLWRHRGVVAHVLYGEDQLWMTAKAPRPRRCIVLATYHQPVAQIPRFLPDTSFIARLDGVVLVSENQTPFFERLLPRDRIHLIPHGVDTVQFAPPLDRPEREKLTVLSVGNWLRDFKTLGKILDHLAAETALAANVKLIFVGHTDPGLIPPAGVDLQVQRGIDDRGLLALYQESDVLLLPLEDSTANNALLEGMACGLAPIVTDIGGVRDYVDDSAAILTRPGDARAMVGALAHFVHDRGALRRLQKAAREQALRHAWPLAAARFQQLYRHYGAEVAVHNAG